MSENGTESARDAGERAGSGYDDQPGLIPDEDLPEDLQPTDDNPLAKDPDDEDGTEDAGPGGKVEGMPDMGQPGA
jgi:hypothetical protein